MSLRTHLASNGDGRENAIVELPECREYLELQRRVFANAYFSKQKVKSRANTLIGRPSHQAQSCMLKLDRSYYVIKNSQFVLPVSIQSLRLRIEVMLFL